ncbi:unnamed protein product [Ixodes pacificus]
MKLLLLAVFCLVISAEVEDAIGAEDSDTASESNPNIQKGEIYQEIGRQLKAEANAPYSNGRKVGNLL